MLSATSLQRDYTYLWVELFLLPGKEEGARINQRN